MKLKMIAVAGVLVMAASNSVVALADESAAAHALHSHEGAEAASLELNQGEKWQTDAPLRQGMEGVHDALQGKLQSIHDNELPKSEYKDLADEVDFQVTYMFENCALPPEADAQLHTLLAQILAGTNQMRSDADPRAGAVQLVKALEAYPRHFEHKGWSSLEH